MYMRLTVLCVSIFVVDIAYALPQQIRISRGAEYGAVEVRYNAFTELLRLGEEKEIGGVARILCGADGLTLLNGTSDIGEFELFSKEIQVTLDSFAAPKCKVSAPNINVMGTTCIDDFYADIRDAANGLFKITGTLATKLLSIFGQTEINGTVNIAEDGCVALKKFGGNNSVTINGRLISQGVFRIDDSSARVRFINNGEIESLSGQAFFPVSFFTNGESGCIRSMSISFELDNGLENLGKLQFENFSISLPSRLASVADFGFNPVNFYQRGIFSVTGLATMGCNFESFGRSIINQLVFPHVAELKVLAGQTHIDSVHGNVPVLQSKDGAITTIGNLEGGTEFIESLHGKLQIGAITSSKRSVFTSRFGGSISVERADTPSSFMFSQDSRIEIGGLHGFSAVFAKGSSRFKVTDATQLDILTTESSHAKVAQSTVNRAYLLSNGPSKFLSTAVDSVANRGEFVGVGTRIASFRNEGGAIFSGTTAIKSLSNYREVSFSSGEHDVTRYFGENSQSRLKVTGETDDSDDGQAVRAVFLQDGDAKVCVESLCGTGIIDAYQQTYRAKIPTSFHIIGNADSFISRMPFVSEIPNHEGGEIRFRVTLHEDFINAKDIDYGDAILFMDLHGNRWENQCALFGAGGLLVCNASVFGNTDGIISLEQFLDVQARRLFNISHPIVRDNGRLVDDWSNWRARLRYYCPATYYSANLGTGINVGGDIMLHSEANITNCFSNITSLSGTFNATAGGIFENTVGRIFALGEGPSSITARTIVNASLPAYLREGSAHASGRCGWGCNRHTWHAYSHTAEVVTQSHGSMMCFGGNTAFVGHTDNIGSQILNYGTFSGDVSSISILENVALCGSLGTLLNGSEMSSQRSCALVYSDFDVGME